MPVRLQMEGLTQLQAALRALPEELVQDASAIVQAHATDAKQQIQAAYPEGPTGNLKRGVTVNTAASRGGTAAIVRSRAPHAWMYENGSGSRQNRRGANRGRTPAAPTFIPIAMQALRRMVQALIDLVQKAGLVVTTS